MSIRVGVGDAVLVQVNDKLHPQRIGLVEYIGYIGGQKKRKYIGINLVDRIENGHNGTIHGVQPFKCPPGHGIYVGIKNIIKKLKASELAIHMQQIVTLTVHMQQRLDEYVAALSQRDEYIETLKDTARRLRKQLNALNNHNLHTIRELAPTPPPVDKSNDDAISMVKKNSFSKQKLKQLNFESIQKHSEYTKYKESPKPNDVTSSSEEWSDEDEDEGDEEEDEEDEDDEEEEDELYYEDDFEWVDDDHCVDMSEDKSRVHRRRPTPISVSTSLSRSHKQKSFSSHNTPVSMRSYPSRSQRLSHSTHNTPISRSSSPYHISISPYDANMQTMYDQIMLQQQQQQHLQNIQNIQNIPNIPNIQNVSPHVSPHLHGAHGAPLSFMHHAQQLMASSQKRSNSVDCFHDDSPTIKNRGHGLKLQRSLPCQSQLHIPYATSNSFEASGGIPRTQSMPAKGFRSTPF